MIQISAIIPTYGTPIFLEKSIQSVLNQTYHNWELIIVDDNNPDTEARQKTEELVERYVHLDNRIRYIKHEHNKNGAVARNTGFAVVKGKYISLLDSDDEYMPDRLQKCYDIMEYASDNIAGVYTGCEFRRGGKVYHVEKNMKPGNFLVDTLACQFMFCTGSNIFVRKFVVDELNGFDEAFLRHQDYEFLVRVFEKYDLAAISEPLVIKNNENFNLPNLDKQIAIKKQYLEKFKYIIDVLPQKDINYIMHGNFINVAENAMAQNEFRVANDFYSKAGEYGGLSAREWFRRIVYPFYNMMRRK
ncbi:MAG: glycosyltransferase family 2 protein [Prevotella sp.]